MRSQTRARPCRSQVRSGANDMALKSKEWFYKQCLLEVKGWSRLAHLSWDILEKGIGQRDQTRGHVTQAIGAAQKFLEDYPQYIEDIRNTDPTRPFNILG